MTETKEKRGSTEGRDVPVETPDAKNQSENNDPDVRADLNLGDSQDEPGVYPLLPATEIPPEIKEFCHEFNKNNALNNFDFRETSTPEIKQVIEEAGAVIPEPAFIDDDEKAIGVSPDGR